MAFVTKDEIKANPEKFKGDPAAEEVLNESPPLDAIVDEYLSSGSLTQAANSYIKKLREILEDKTNLIKITAKKLPRTEGGFLFTHDEFGIILLFQDSVMVDIYQVARNEFINNAIIAAHRVDNKIKILNAIILNKHDYEKYNQMADYINNVFRICSNKELSKFNINGFNNNESLIIDINLDNVKNYIDMKSPHGIPARCDIGLVCYRTYGSQRHQSQKYQAKKSLFAVSAYTEFVPDSYASGKPILTPLIHITDIVTSIPMAGIIPLVQAVCAEVFCAYRHWQSPYMKIQKGLVNIGNLIIDPKTNKPKAITNEKELMYMFNEHFSAPALVMDITEGRARIPSITMFANTSMYRTLSNIFKKFFCVTHNDPLEIIGKNPSQSIIGTSNVSNIIKESDYIDSRYIDYLNMVNALGYDDRVSQLFMKYVLDPIKETEVIKSVVENTSFTYLNNEVLLNGQFLRFLVDAISTHVNIINPMNNNVINNVDIKSLLDNTYSSGPILAGNNYTMPNVNSTFRYQF